LLGESSKLFVAQRGVQTFKTGSNQKGRAQKGGAKPSISRPRRGRPFFFLQKKGVPTWGA